MSDIINEMGYIALGSRLRRLGEWLQADVQSLLSDEKILVQSSQLPILATLDKYKSCTVGMIVDSLGITQPGITRSLNNLRNEGLVAFKNDEKDLRVKRYFLTQAGNELIIRAKHDVFPKIKFVLGLICDDAAPNLLDNLATLELALKAQSLTVRSKN